MKSEEELEKELIEAIEELEKIKDDPVMQGILEQREIDLRDKLSIGAANREKGLKQGIAIGEARRNEMIKAMHKKGIEMEAIVEISGLSREEVEKIIKEK